MPTAPHVVQMPVDYSGMQTSELAKQCEVDMYNGCPENHGSTLPEFFGDMQALKLMSSFQAFVRHIGGGASEDTEFEYLPGRRCCPGVPRCASERNGSETIHKQRGKGHAN